MYHANLILFISIGLLCSTITSTVSKRKGSKCGKNEVWKRCIECQHTCDSYLNAWGEYENCFKPKAEDFEKHCKKECICRKNYVRGRSGKCIRPSQCYSYNINYRPDF